MKPKLKAPGTKPLKLKYDKRLLNLAFKFKLRCYTLAVYTAFDGALCVATGVIKVGPARHCPEP
jgi:hypothetical protein